MYRAQANSDQVLVVDPEGDQLAIIPRQVRRNSPTRSYQERWNIAEHLARLLNEESARCHDAAQTKELAHGD